MDILNIFGNMQFKFDLNSIMGSLTLIVASLGLIYITFAARQGALLKKISLGLKAIEQLNQQMNTMINEQRRTNRILAELAGEEVGGGYSSNSNQSSHDSQNGYSGNHNQYAKSSEELELQSQNKLYVGNIDYSASEAELEAHFAPFGKVEFVNIPINRYNGRARGFGFVTFVAKHDAERAMTLNGSEFKGRQIQVNFAKERDSSQ